MNCDRCPHMKEIISAMKPCQVCEAGKLHGQISVDSNTVDWAAKNKAHRVENQDEERDLLDQIDDVDAENNRERESDEARSVTCLDPAQEDRLRSAMMALFDLEPVELLLVQHIMHGGTYAGFAKPMHDILRKLRTKEAELIGKKEGFRSLAHTWAKKLAEKMPQLEPVLRARIEG